MKEMQGSLVSPFFLKCVFAFGCALLPSEEPAAHVSTNICEAKLDIFRPLCSAVSGHVGNHANYKVRSAETEKEAQRKKVDAMSSVISTQSSQVPHSTNMEFHVRWGK